MSLPSSRSRVGLMLTVVWVALSMSAIDAQAGDYTWTERPAPGTRLWYGMASSDDGLKLVASPSDGYIYTSTDGGVNWTEQTGSGSRSWSNVASSSDGTKLVATVYNGYIYTSTDSGVTWTERTAPGSRQWVGINCTPDGTKWAATARGALIYTSSDSGATWTAQSGSGSRGWRHVAMSSDGTKLVATVYTGSGTGYFYTSTDSGVTWTEHTDGGLSDWYACAITDDGTKLAVASAYSNGYVWTSTDSGATWTERTSSGQRTWLEFDCTPDGGLLIAGTRNTVCVSRDWGATWTEETDPGTKDWAGVATSTDASKVAVCGYSGTIFTGAASIAAPTVTTASASDVTASAATGGGEVTADGGVGVTARGVCWSTASNPTTGDDTTSDGLGTGVFTSDITGLDPVTTYHVRAYATNSVGTSYGADVEFTTLAAVPTVTTAAVVNVAQSNATSGGEVTDDGGASVTARGVCWSTAANPTTADDTTTDGTDTGIFTSNIEGLDPATTYHVRAYATNSAGTSYGADVEFTTLAAAPTVTTAAVTDIAQTEATCGGEITDNGGAAVTARGVCWNTSSHPTIVNDKTTDGTGTGVFTSSLTGLSPSTTYYVCAYSTNSAGTSYGTVRSFTTLAEEPNEPAADPNEPADDPNEATTTSADLQVTIETSSQSARVGEELEFEVGVQNIGNADATNVSLRLPLPAGTEFIGAWLVAEESEQATPLDAQVESDEIVIALGDVAVAEEMKIEVVLKSTSSGEVALEASLVSDQQDSPVTAQANSSVDVEDVYYEIINSTFPFSTCGAFGLVSPLMIMFGLLALKRYR